MKYLSTRGQTNISFIEALLSGYASDGGMILPEHIPRINAEQLRAWRNLEYVDLCTNICSLFVDEDEINRDDLRNIVRESFKMFEEPTHGQIIPVLKAGDLFLAELFHGPTLAFKDLALQFVGQLLVHTLENKEKVILVNILAKSDAAFS